MRKKQAETFTSLSSGFPPETVAKWSKMVKEWELDRSKPNPYEEPEIRMFKSFINFLNTANNLIEATLQDVRLELAKEDAADTAKGVVSPHSTSVTEFLIKGLELEEQQYVVFLYNVNLLILF